MINQLKYIFLAIISLIILTSCGNGNCTGKNNINPNATVMLDSEDGGVADKGINISQKPLLILKFSLPMNVSSVNSQTILLSTQPNPLGSSLVQISNITYNNDNTKFSFYPLNSLLSNTKYYLIVQNTVSNGGFTVNNQFSFTTGDFIAPTVGLINPSNGQSNVSLTPNIQLQFSESVLNVESVNVLLHKDSESGSIIAISQINSMPNNVYSFTLNAPLAESTNYFISLNNHITDYANNPLNPTTFNFKTLKNQYRVAVSDGSFIIRSVNHGQWTLIESDEISHNIFQNVIYANNMFVTIGKNYYSGRMSILTSNDGDNWIPAYIPSNISSPSNLLLNVTYGNGKFISVGSNGVILDSMDGINWQQESSGSESDLVGVTYGNGIFVVVCTSGTVLTSTNGSNWQHQSTGLSNNTDFDSVNYSNGKFVAVGRAGVIYSSLTGTVWQAELSGTTDDLRSIAYGNGKFVTVGSSAIILNSTGNTIWQQESSNLDPAIVLWSINYNQGEFIAGGTDGILITSTDGMHWTPESSGVSFGTINGIASSS